LIICFDSKHLDSTVKELGFGQSGKIFPVCVDVTGIRVAHRSILRATARRLDL